MASLAGSKKVTVVGAGWSGLASAYFLSKSGFDVQVFESHSDAGGMLSTQMTEHGMVEPAANAMIANPQIMDVAEEIGVELLEPLKSSKKRFFFTKGKIKRWPLDLKKSLHSGLSFIISRGKSPRSGESVYEWGLRIFGKKFTEDVLGTALQGIYGSHDLNQLSASLIFSQFFEKKDKQNKKEKKRSVAPRSGMKEWADKMMIFLKNRGVNFEFGKKLSSEDINELSRQGLVVIATNAHQAATLLKDVSSEQAEILETVPTIDVTSVTRFYPADNYPIQGFGILFSPGEKMHAMGLLLNHCIFESRSEFSSETWIFEGDYASEEEFIEECIAKDRMKLFGRAEPCVASYKNAWKRGLPFYNLKLERLLEELSLESLKKKNVFLCGNYLGQLSLAKMLSRAEELSQQVKSHYRVLAQQSKRQIIVSEAN